VEHACTDYGMYVCICVVYFWENSYLRSLTQIILQPKDNKNDNVNILSNTLAIGLDNKNDYFQILLNTLATGLKSNEFHKYCVPTCFARNIDDLVHKYHAYIVYEQPQPLN